MPYSFPSGDEIAAVIFQALREQRLCQGFQIPEELAHQRAVALLMGHVTGQRLLDACQVNSFNPNQLEIFCPSRETAKRLRNLYLKLIKSVDWRQLPTLVSFQWSMSRKPFSVPNSFAANYTKDMVENSNIIVTPHSREEELMQEIRESSLPAGISSMRAKMPVLAINELMMPFTGQLYDDLIGDSIVELFRKRQEQQPDDLIIFNERLIKDKVVHGELKAFRSSGAFGVFHGTFKYETMYGIPVRMSFYEGFELIT